MIEKFNLEEIKNKTFEQLNTSKSSFGKDGAFVFLLKNILNATLKSEMAIHMNVLEVIVLKVAMLLANWGKQHSC